MFGLILAIDVIVAILIIALVLLQQGKGATMGASFGSGSSNTVFGSRGAAPFMFKLTAFLVAIFFASSLALGYIGKHDSQVAVKQAQAQTSQEAYQQFQEQKAQVQQQKQATTAGQEAK